MPCIHSTVNRVRLIGRVQHPPRYYCTPRGQDLTRFTLATRGEGNGMVYHECVAWGGPAFALYDHLSGGELLAIEGKLRYRSPASRKDTYVVVQHFNLLDRSGPTLADVAHHPAGTYPVDHADQ